MLTLPIKKNFGKVISLITNNDNIYSDKELLYLFLRPMISITWKLDVLFFTHLPQCAQANILWTYMLGYLAKNEIEGNHYTLLGMPYWLRNEQINFLSCLPKEYRKRFLAVELAMHKANDIQAQCKLLGDTYIIVLDCGLYTYLYEWCKLLLCGYRIKKYCIENDFDITEPVKIGTNLILSIVNALRNNGSVYSIPPSAMSFRANDQVIIKEIITTQLDFILGHEFGHIICSDQKMENTPHQAEYAADCLSLDFLKSKKITVSILNKKGNSGLSIEENDIQSKNELERKIEAIEILFAFYEMYYYVCEKQKYTIPLYCTHPEITERRDLIKRNYPMKKYTPLIDYADSLVFRIKENIDASI